MEIYEGSILPSSSSSRVFSLQKIYIFQALLLPFQYGTRKNNDWNSQETWVSLGSVWYVVELSLARIPPPGPGRPWQAWPNTCN